jgi:hypothetical protein
MPAMGLSGRPGLRVDDVVRADDDGHIGLGEVFVDLVHLHHDVVGHLGLGQQHVHVAGHAARHRVDGKAHIHALLAQGPGDFVDRVLGLGHGHAVAGHDDGALGFAQHLGVSAALTGATSPWGSAAAAAPPFLAGAPAEAARNHADEVAVHGLAHDVAQDGAREPTSAPVTISRSLPSMKPVAAAAQPE